MARHPKNLQIPFEDMLVASKAQFEYMYHEYQQGLCSTPNYNLRYSLDEVEIGVRANFDRWANSVDFICRPLPRSQEDFDALFGALDLAVKEGRKSEDEYGSYDIWPLVRKYKRLKRKEDHQAK